MSLSARYTLSRYTLVHLGILLLVGFGVSIRPTFANSAPLRAVDLGYAKYQTDISLEEGVTSFLGIRFGASVAGTSLFHLLRKCIVSANHVYFR